MMNTRSVFLFLILISSILWGCSGKLDTGDIDVGEWKRDRFGCEGLRIQYEAEFRKIKNDYLGKNNQSLIKTFGRPDRVELAGQSQTFFIYFLEPADNCDGETKKEPLKVLFRLNAINRVSEVTVTHLNP